MSLESVVCCQVKVPASGCSLVQRSSTECGVSECDGQSSIVRRSWPTSGGGLLRHGKTKKNPSAGKDQTHSHVTSLS